MNCEVIQDLLPLYIDGCCSDTSSKLVIEHIKSCPECRKMYEAMSKNTEAHLNQPVNIKLQPINNWKASILQSVMLFVSFALITLGVILEGSTPSGETNGLWAMALIVPATGYLLSLAHWYFVRLYKNRRKFSLCTTAATLTMTAIGYVWALFHYSQGLKLTSFMVWGGLVLSVIFCLLSGVLSNQYALLCGKD